MLKNLSFIKKCIQYCAAPNARLLCNAISVASVENKPLPPVADIDMDKLMYEDSNGELVDNAPPQEDQQLIKSAEVKTKTADGGAALLPVDIDPWVDEEEVKQGTIEIDDEENKRVLPPIPENRQGKYEFRGIKVFLPRKMLQPKTYRYRLDADDKAQLADDMRICRFEK